MNVIDTLNRLLGDPNKKELKTLALQKIVRPKPTMSARPGSDVAKKAPATATEQKQIESELEKALEKI